MSTEQLAQALLTGLGAAQELLEIKRKELGDDYSKTYGYWKAERELSAALAAHEAEKAAPAVPTGLKLVPVEPTPDMLKACEAEWFGSQVDMAKREWAAMLAAAPAAPASASEAPVAVPLTDEELRDALRQCPHDAVENLRVRWLYATDFAREIERECAARWGVKLEGGQE